jgi:hypothetical protein
MRKQIAVIAAMIPTTTAIRTANIVHQTEVHHAEVHCADTTAPIQRNKASCPKSYIVVLLMNLAHSVTRRNFQLAIGGGAFLGRQPLKPIVISVNLMFDSGAHSGNGLGDQEIALFNRYQEETRREYATSGIFFDIKTSEGAYLRQQGYSEIPEKFLILRAINLLVTDSLGYDIDKDRTGGCSIGPRPRRPKFAADRFYKIFLGLRDAAETVLPHEYAHHFTLDTQRQPTVIRNSWADLRNDYWLWRQRHGVPISQFRACANSAWAKVQS